MSTTASGTASTTAFPVRVEARLDEPLSRGLWLVKWLLAVPHYVVLAFLWVAFGVTTVMAFFAILVTGRYPRVLFDFTVGVLRWSWRVSFYTYSALGTDRYPPFTLHDVPDYPAHLEVDRPQSLSRGLVLVKWWLLALPHYLVLGFLVGGAGYAAREAGGWEQDWDPWSGGGLIGLLVFVAGVALLCTGRYPPRLFDLVVGLNRWVLRVAAYSSLMTDRYPPFALDQGGQEVGGEAALPSVGVSPVRDASGWSPGRVVGLVVGSVVLVTGLGLGGLALALTVVDHGARDRDGFLVSSPTSLESSTYAITASSPRLHADTPGADLPSRLLGDARLTVTSGTGEDVFLGIAPTRDVERYLAGVDHEEVTGFQDGRPVYEAQTGPSLPEPPSRQTFWVVEDSGPGRQSITWPLDEGGLTVVLMNADGSAGVAAELTVGAQLPVLDDAARVLWVLSALAVIVGVVAIAVPLRLVIRDQRADRPDRSNP